MKKSILYTGTGDSGQTSLVGGERIDKDDARLEAYGTIDELNSHIGVLLATGSLSDTDTALLTEVQSRLFDVGAYLATNPTSPYAEAMSHPAGPEQISALEQAIDRLDESLPPMKSFILPGGTQAAAQAHVARTVCRRAERRIITLARSEGVEPDTLRYINRLSDYLFILARALNRNAGAPETPWTKK